MDAAAVKEGIHQTQCLSFHVAGEEYAIEILQVKEIIEYDEITTVPMTPPSVRGVINLRGSVVPVVDLAVKFGLPATGVTKRTCIVIVEVELDGKRTVMGVMADAVSQVIEFVTDDIEAPPSFGTGVEVEYLRGMGRVGKKFVLLLDIDKVLSAEELEAVALVQAEEEAEEEAEEPEVSTQPDTGVTAGEQAGTP